MGIDLDNKLNNFLNASGGWVKVKGMIVHLKDNNQSALTLLKWKKNLNYYFNRSRLNKIYLFVFKRVFSVSS